MNRITITIFWLALIVLLCGAASATDIYINETGWWCDSGSFNASGTPIQAAIDNAIAGDTIYVYNGSYTENMRVNKRLTLQGADMVTVTAADANDHVFNVTADYVNISGFNVTGAKEKHVGVFLPSANHCNISNNIASGNDFGIFLWNSSDNTLTDNDCSGNYYNGIRLLKADRNTLTGNDCSDTSVYGFFSRRNCYDNTIEDLNVASYPTTISFTYENGIAITGVKTPPADPPGKANINRYLNTKNLTANSWLFLNISYNETDLEGIDESSLRLWQHNGTAWNEVTGSGVNMDKNYVYANITEFSVLAPMGDLEQGLPIPAVSPPGVALMIGLLAVARFITLRRRE